MSVKGILEHEDRYLLLQNHRDEYELPGGQPENGEAAEDTVAREIREETGIQIAGCQYVGGESFEVVPGSWVFIVAFACKAEDTGVRIGQEHRDHRWCHIDDLPHLRLPAVYRRMIHRSRR